MSPSDPGDVSKRTGISDLRGIARLAADAIEGTSRLAEGVHQSVWDTLGVRGGAAPGQTGGVTGLAYASVRGVTRLARHTSDALLTVVEKRLGASGAAGHSSTQREVALAALNGVIGDHLVATGNPLATTLTLRQRGQPLQTGAAENCSPRVLIMLHGLCLSEIGWRTQRAGQVLDHGEEVSRAYGHAPIYARYNSGLHISQNGRELSTALERMVAGWPVPVEEISVIAHSMGGLVMRSAIQAAQTQGARWRGALRRVVFLGTPHHGAPLERGGNWLESILDGNRWTRSFAPLARVRSAGITDLRYGHVVDEDWMGRDRFRRDRDHRVVTPLPPDIAFHAVAASTAKSSGSLASRMLGDGLVPLTSALGQHADPQRTLAFSDEASMVAYDTNHMQLLGSREVADQLLRWFDPAPSAGR